MSAKAGQLGQKIKLLRQRKKITQEKLARILNINRTTLANWENGRAEPDTEQLRKIAIYFNVTLDELLDMPETAALYPTAVTDQTSEQFRENPDREWGNFLIFARQTGLGPKTLREIIEWQISTSLNICQQINKTKAGGNK
ncbi:helix-turn-helix domain-containing protein [Desulfurispora thermophila]|uniref:helix-turn-helix domain-containing protein n=1 Tax=Desulfurispora thermophila TaxID=265470 RepID=UPI0003605921|nr:helix-turn-helix transcriptional regulator [Desulfurispora thermophila]